ncbi:MAG: glycosyltransferase family 4 protein [Chloroflexi bacterium]|nr:glycosyltransferase family 4 protein [Chloroflexota bacterium]
MKEDCSRPYRNDRIRIAFFMEQNLGHATFSRNLVHFVGKDSSVDPTWVPIDQNEPPAGLRERLTRGNWSLRASLKARAHLQILGGPSVFNTIFYHTQVTALLSVAAIRLRHGVISLDATPLNYDAVGQAYGHQPGPRPIEIAKSLLNRRAFHAAAHLITWSSWARSSLIRDYGVNATRVTVIPPGTDLSQWSPRSRGQIHDADGQRKVRLLFVGGDFKRKGGPLLISVFRNHFQTTCELDMVTNAPVKEVPPGVRIHRGLTPNCGELRLLFQNADIFVFPSLADCLALVLQEAAASGLPVITTDIGALGEAIQDRNTGLLIPAGDGGALTSALQQLVADPQTRERMGAGARVLAEEQFDAAANSGRILGVLKDAAGANPVLPGRTRHAQPLGKYAD